MLDGSAGSAGEHAEEGLDVGVGGHVPVAVEVGAAAGGAAVAGEAGEEGFDVGVGAGVAVVVEVGAAAGGAGGLDRGRGACGGVAGGGGLVEADGGQGARG